MDGPGQFGRFGDIYQVSSGSTSYQRINPTVETLTAYTDTTVQSGSAYAIVKNVDAQGVEYAPFNSTSVTIP